MPRKQWWQSHLEVLNIHYTGCCRPFWIFITLMPKRNMGSYRWLKELTVLTLLSDTKLSLDCLLYFGQAHLCGLIIELSLSQKFSLNKLW